MTEQEIRLNIAIWVLITWLQSYDIYRGYRYGPVRRRAMYARARGLIEHDRVLTGRVPL